MTSPLDPFGPPQPADQPARELLRSELERGKLLFQKLLVPASIVPDDNLNHLLNQFDDRTLNAFISLFYQLDQLCFHHNQSIIDQNGAVTSKQVLDYLSRESIVELHRFITLIFNSTPMEFPGRDRIVDFFELWLDRAEGELTPSNTVIWSGKGASEITALQAWYDKIKEIAKNFDDALKAGAAADAAQEALAETIRARDATVRAAGETGAASLGNHFDDVAKGEGWKATGWTVASFLGIAAIIGLSTRIVYHTVSSEWVNALLHLIVVVPIIGAATYASTLARHHRVISRWAKTARVQINSVEAFSQQLSTAANRDELILALGKNVFSAPNYGDDLKREHFSTLPPDVIEAFKVVANRLPGGSH